MLAWWLTPRLARVAAARGLVARPWPRGIHRTPTPVSGGATIVVSAALVLAVLWSRAHPPTWIILPSLLIAALGTLDDVVALRWATKLALEIAIAALALWLDGQRSVDAHAIRAVAWLVRCRCTR